MFAGSDQIQIFAFDFVHHGIHLGKTHNAGNYVAADHKWRYAVSKSTVDHEITCVCDHCGMQSCDVSHQVIESVSGNFSCTVKVDTVERFHDFCMVWDFKIRNNRLTEAFDLYVFAVIFSDRHRRIDDVRDNHHVCFQFFFYFSFFCGKFVDTISTCCYLTFYFLCLFFFTLFHQAADLFGQFVSFCTQSFYFLFDLTVSLVQLQYFIYQRQFFILEFISDILFYNFRIFSHKFNV